MTEAERRRFERRVLGSHERWSLLARLKLGRVTSNDGQPLLRASCFDLYCMWWLLPNGEPELAYVHPRWLKQ